MEKDPFKPRRDFFGHLLLELEFHGRMLLASPERRKQILQALRMLRLSRQANLYALARYREQAAFRDTLRKRPLSFFPRVTNAIWSHLGLFALGFSRSGPSADELPACKAYDLARRGKPEAALRTLDALIARLERGPADNLRTPQRLTNVHLFAGAVGYMVCEETAGAYYARAVELASYKTPALLVLGAIFVRLGRIDEARAAWDRALGIEREKFANDERGSHTLGQWESLQDAKVELEKLEKMVASLQPEAAFQNA